MSAKEYLTKEEVDILLNKAQNGDNEAWEILYRNFEAYIHKRVNDALITFSDRDKAEIKDDLFQAGWIGFIEAMKNYKGGNNKFLTYATSYIDGEIKRQRKFYMNSLGISECPNDTVRSKIEDTTIDAEPTDAKYPAEGRAIQILELLRLLTDEDHTLSKKEIKELLRLYRAAKFGYLYKLDADNTITSTIEQIIEELDPLEYTEDNADDYTVLYEGYKENRFKVNKNSANQKSQPLTGFSYNHLFSDRELDELIAQICFSDIISYAHKTRIVKQLVSTASIYYKSPFFDGERIRFNPQAVHGRYDSKNAEERTDFINNIAALQEALNNLAQVRFIFNRYNENGELEPTSDYIHILSPYHLVKYRDNHYCIGLKKDDKRIWHYRVDLMSDVEIVRDEDGQMVHIELSDFDGLPISNASWDPERYMSEHLNMAYDEPRNISIKIRNTDYTILHDWFGNHYEKTNQQVDNGYVIVKVKTSPSMIVHLVMQYSDRLEIMDEDIRKKISEEIDKLSGIYKVYCE